MAFRDFPAPYIPSSPGDPLAIDYENADSPAFSEQHLPQYLSYSSLFPPRAEVQDYLEAYARTYDLYRHIRFRTKVLRVYLSEGVSGHAKGRRWTVVSRTMDPSDRSQEVNGISVANGARENGNDGGLKENGIDGSDARGDKVGVVEEFDYICCANGHYADTWIPEIPGLRCVPSLRRDKMANP